MDARIALPGSSYSREALQALEKCRRVSGARRSADIKNARDDAGVYLQRGILLRTLLHARVPD